MFCSQTHVYTDLKDVAEQYGLHKKVAFRHQVQSATFDERNAHWIVNVIDHATNKQHIYTARIFFSCVGALSVPRKCDVPGIEKFRGKVFHSARWDPSVELEDKNVVILGEHSHRCLLRLYANEVIPTGNGCTASQIVPQIASKVRHLTQIVRAKHW